MSSRQTSARLRTAHGFDHLVAAADLGDDLEVGLQAEQRGQAPRTSAWSSASSTRIGALTAHPQHACRARLGPGREREPAAGRLDPLPHAAHPVALRRGPPARGRRRRQRASRLPASSTQHSSASLWRTTLVTASRSTHASTMRCRGSTTRPRSPRRQVRGDAGARERRSRGSDLVTQARRPAARRPWRGSRRAPDGSASGSRPARPWRARGRASTSRSASSALTVTTVSEWPSTSCTSRATRSRSATSASSRGIVEYCPLRSVDEADAGGHGRRPAKTMPPGTTTHAPSPESHDERRRPKAATATSPPPVAGRTSAQREHPERHQERQDAARPHHREGHRAQSAGDERQHVGRPSPAVGWHRLSRLIRTEPRRRRQRRRPTISTSPIAPATTTGPS